MIGTPLALMKGRFQKMFTQKCLRGHIMFNSIIALNNKVAWRKKAQANICIAKELAEIFGGGKADYLKRLNRKLRIKITAEYLQPFAKAA
jgi:hypothetical protein